jgi:hypothetical protein
MPDGDAPAEHFTHSLDLARTVHAERLSTFMEQFEVAARRARTTCKSNAIVSLFGGSSPTSIAARPDRGALLEVHGLLSELYTDVRTLEVQALWTAHAAACVRLHSYMHLLLSMEPTETPKLSFIAPEAAVAVEALRLTAELKPKGTVAEVLGDLRPALSTLARSLVDLVHSALLSGDASAPKGADTADRSQMEEMRCALQQTQEQAQQQLQAWSERCAAVEQHAAALAHRLSEGETAEEVREAARAEGVVAARGVEEQQARELAAAREVEVKLQGELEAMGRQLEAAGKELEAAELRASASAAETEEERQGNVGLRGQLQHLTSQLQQQGTALAQLEQRHAQLCSAHQALEQRSAGLALLEQQVGGVMAGNRPG